MKKLLALVLALVMSMSLVTISNAAFKDADKIDYKEAVDVMNAVGVFIGDEKGNFNAKDNLTREQAAKIIAYLELGEKAADALVGSATFTDVAATRWSAGFVSYCAQAGVVAGYDGKFDPAGQLTALQFGKMLLVEIGYDAKAAGMVGTDWAINTSKLIATTGLMNGIDGSVNQVLSREKAAQMTLNALKTPTVEYATKGSNITVNGAEINFGASVPTYVTSTIAKEQRIGKDTLTNSNGKTYTVELGEKLYTKLALNDTKDAFDRPAHEWKLGTTVIGTYNNEADLEYTTGVKYKEVYSDLGLSEKTKTTEYYKNGKEQTNVELNKSADAKFGKNGVLTQVWYDDDNGKLIVSEIDTFVGKVNSVTKATSSADRYITITKAAEKALSALDTKFETESFAKGDLVTYTAAENDDGRYEIQTVAALEKSTTGTLTEWNGTGAILSNDDKADAKNNFTVDGTTYKYSKNCYVVGDDGFSDKSDISAFDVDKSELNVYLDQYGYAIYVSGVEGTKNYAAVIGLGSTNQYGSQTRGATLLLPDGTQKEVKAKADNWDDFKVAAAGSAAPYEVGKNLVTDGLADIVTYTEDDGVYKLTLVKDTPAQYSDVYKNTADLVQFVNGRSRFDLSAVSGVRAKNLYTTSETVFMVATHKVSGNATKGINYNVYVGYENMPSIDEAEKTLGIAYVTNSTYTDQIDVVYLYTNKLAGISSVDTYVVKKADADIITNSKGDYYVLPAIVDGEETTVMISADYAAATAVFTKKGSGTSKYFEDAYGLYALSNVTKNSKGIIDSFDVVNSSVFNATSGSYVEGTVAANKVVLGINGNNKTATFWAYNDKTNVYVVDKDYKTITVSSVANVDTDANDLVYASYTTEGKQKKLADVVIVEQDDVVLSNDTSLKTFKVKGVDVVNGKVTLTNLDMASTTAARLVVETNDANATIKSVEWKSATQTTWTSAGFPASVYGAAGDDSGDPNWNNDFQIKVTVETKDGTIDEYVVAVKKSADTYVAVTYDIAAKTRVTVNDKVIADGEEVDYKVGDIVTLKVVKAASATGNIKVTYNGAEVDTFEGGIYDITIAAAGTSVKVELA